MQSKTKKSSDHSYLKYLLSVYQKRRLHIDSNGDVYDIDTGGPLATRTKLYSITKPDRRTPYGENLDGLEMT
jgi:hypothetical protein